MKRHLFLSALLIFTCIVTAHLHAGEDATDDIDQTNKLIEQLDHPELKERESAQIALSELPIATLPHLQKALENEMRMEVSSRLENAITLLKLKTFAKKQKATGLVFYLEAEDDTISEDKDLNLTLYIYNTGKKDLRLSLGYGQNHYANGQFLRPKIMQKKRLIRCKQAPHTLLKSLPEPLPDLLIKAGEWVSYTNRLQLKKVPAELTKKHGLYILKTTEWAGYFLKQATEFTIDMNHHHTHPPTVDITRPTPTSASAWRGKIQTNSLKIKVE